MLLIHFKEAFPFIAGFYPILLLILGILIIAEILYLFERHNPKKYKSLWFVAKRKLENIFEVLLGFSAIGQVYVLAREIRIMQHLPEILKWAGYIGAALIIIYLAWLVIWAYLKLSQWIKVRR
mgnify:CR=1 FL=1